MSIERIVDVATTPALTFGQEVGSCDYWSSRLTKNVFYSLN
jgi:hypothetical protein